MSVKFIAPFAILGVAGLLITACGDEPEADVGSKSGAPAVVDDWEDQPVSADSAVRRELAKLEAERVRDPEVVDDWGDWPMSAEGAVRRELAKLEAERVGDPEVVDDWGDWPMSAEGAIRRELAKLEAERVGD